MYRRICLIYHGGPGLDFIQGLCGFLNGDGADEINDAWISMPGPKKHLYKNGRFYFTEKGWDLYGRKVVAACIKHSQDYRVLASEEHDVDVIYKDDIQVVIRPKRKRSAG